MCCFLSQQTLVVTMSFFCRNQYLPWTVRSVWVHSLVLPGIAALPLLFEHLCEYPWRQFKIFPLYVILFVFGQKRFSVLITFIVLTNIFKTSIQILAVNPSDGVMLIIYDGTRYDLWSPQVEKSWKWLQGGIGQFYHPKTKAGFGWILRPKLNFSACLIFIIYKVLLHISKKKWTNDMNKQIAEEEIQMANKNEKMLNLSRHQVKCGYNDSGLSVSLTKRNFKIGNVVLVRMSWNSKLYILLLKGSFAVLTKNLKCVLTDPALTLRGICPPEVLKHMFKDLYKTVILALIAKKSNLT